MDVRYDFWAHIEAVERSADDTSSSMRRLEAHAQVESFFATGGVKRIVSRKSLNEFSLGSELEEVRILKNINLLRAIDRQSLILQEIELKKLKLDLTFVVTAWKGRGRRHTLLFAAKLFIKQGEIAGQPKRDNKYEVIKIENFETPEIEFSEDANLRLKSLAGAGVE